MITSSRPSKQPRATAMARERGRARQQQPLRTGKLASSDVSNTKGPAGNRGSSQNTQSSSLRHAGLLKHQLVPVQSQIPSEAFSSDHYQTIKAVPNHSQPAQKSSAARDWHLPQCSARSAGVAASTSGQEASLQAGGPWRHQQKTPPSSVPAGRPNRQNKQGFKQPALRRKPATGASEPDQLDPITGSLITLALQATPEPA